MSANASRNVGTAWRAAFTSSSSASPEPALGPRFEARAVFLDAGECGRESPATPWRSRSARSVRAAFCSRASRAGSSPGARTSSSLSGGSSRSTRPRVAPAFRRVAVRSAASASSTSSSLPLAALAVAGTRLLPSTFVIAAATAAATRFARGSAATVCIGTTSPPAAAFRIRKSACTSPRRARPEGSRSGGQGTGSEDLHGPLQSIHTRLEVRSWPLSPASHGRRRRSWHSHRTATPIKNRCRGERLEGTA